MSFDFSTLIANRTPADVSRVKELAYKIRSGTASESELEEFNSAAMKGAYNHTDLNRVTAAMESLKAKLEGYGYAVPGYQRIRVPHTKESRLPEGYTELAWIESTGTQYIDTGFKHNQDTRTVMDVQATSMTANAWAFGGRITNSNARHDVFYYNTNSTWASDYHSSRKYPEGIGATDRVLIDFDKNVCAFNGVTVTHEATTFQSTANLVLLALNTAGTISGQMSAKLYSCQIYDNGTLVRDYVPCTNSAGVAGLYDLANDVFYQNAGTGSFVAGDVVSTATMATKAAVSDDVVEYDPYTWYEFDYPTPKIMTMYLLNVAAIRSVIAVMKSTPSVPPDVSNFMTQEANDIEKILGDVNLLLINSSMSWYYSNDLFSGEV